MTAASEAIEIYRQLADEITGNPDAYLHLLAAALQNLGLILDGAGRVEGAIARTDEAIDIAQLRGHACTESAGPAPSARGLTQQCQLSIGRNSGELGRAQALVSESLELYSELAPLLAKESDFVAEWAQALSNGALAYARASQRTGASSDLIDNACAASWTAVELCRSLNSGDVGDGPFLRLLARALWNVAWVSDETNAELARGLSAAKESVLLYDTLASSQPSLSPERDGAVKTLRLLTQKVSDGGDAEV